MEQSGYIPVEENAPPPIGAFVKQVREALHVTQAGLARRCNLSRAYINALESGNVKGPSARTLGLLAAALEIDILEILEASGVIKLIEGQGLTNEAQLATHLRRERGLSETSVQSIIHLIALYELGDRQAELKASVA